MDGEELSSLLTKYKKGTSTAEEKALLENWVAGVTYPEYEIDEQELMQDLAEISQRLPLLRRRVRLWPRIAVVAAAMAVIVFGVWLYTSDNFTTTHKEIAYTTDIAPGKNRATLTLANGKTVTLSDSKMGVVFSDSGVTYNDGAKVAAEVTQPQLLSTTTPRGGTYQITLPDGTRVWMNADSKLSFPSDFSEEKRMVLLQGEAYFEVAKSYRSKVKAGQRVQERVPFVVKTDKQEVTVLGTHFNINSYADEPATKTTLLEGSVGVKISGDSNNPGPALSYILNPGEQAVNDGQIQVSKVDLGEVVAWKSGSILFKDKTLEGIMRELARWYDVKIVYAAGAPKYETFSGAVSRARNISTVLERMQTTGSVRFKIEGRTITVTK